MATTDTLPVRCHQCKQVFQDSNQCGQHGFAMGHVHRPSYYCPEPGCVLAFNKRQERLAHMQSTGHKIHKIPAKLLPKASNSPKPATSPSLAASAANSKAVTCFACTPNRTYKDAAALADHRKAVHTMATPPAASHGPGATSTTAQPTAGPPAAASTAANHCKKCKYDFPTESALQTHYNESVVHPHCRTCGLGFESIVSYVMHKGGCPPPGTYAANGVPANQKDEPAATQAGNRSSSSVAAAASAGAPSEEPETVAQPSMSRVPLTRQITGFSEAASVVSSRATVPTAAHSPSTPIERPASLAGSVANGHAGARARPAASHVLSRSQSTSASPYGPDDEAERVYRALQGQRVEAPEPVRSGQTVNGRATERNHSPSGWSTSTVEASEPASAPVRSGHAVNARATERSHSPSRWSTSTRALQGQRVEAPEPASAPVRSGQVVNGMATERNRSPSGWSTSTRPLQGQRIEAPAPEPQPVRSGHAVNGRATERSHSPAGWSASTYGDPMPAPARTASPPPQRYTPQRAPPVQAATPMQARAPARPARAARAAAPSASSGMSFHCRSCLNDPVEPVTTMCGHLFCHSCIIQEIATRMCCPVCQKVFLVRLDLEA